MTQLKIINLKSLNFPDTGIIKNICTYLDVQSNISMKRHPQHKITRRPSFTTVENTSEVSIFKNILSIR